MVLFTSDVLFLGTRKIFFTSENHFLIPKNELSDINTTYIDISNGQKFELCTYLKCRLDEDLTNSNVSVTVAAAVEEVIIEAPEELVAGMDGNIICTVKGGRPAPILNFDFGRFLFTSEL